MTLHYPIADVAPYINWLYFFHAWGIEPRYASIASIHGCDSCRATWLATFPVEQRAKAAEAMQLHKEAMRLLDSLIAEGRSTHAIVKLYTCNSNGDDIILYHDSTTPPTRLSFLRQQQPPTPDAPCLCLADFIRPIQSPVCCRYAATPPPPSPCCPSAATTTPPSPPIHPDRIALFATAADPSIEHLHENDPYTHLLAQTLADRLAEATAELLHLQVRKTIWAYAPDEDLPIPDLLAERFQGIRPAVGYPSLPDQSLNFDLDALLHFADIGITLTETGAMRPHAAVSGLMLAHPQARYFAVGHITEEQLLDYAHRRQRTPSSLRPFLAQLLP